MRRASLAGIVQKFSRASRIGKFSFAPALLPGKLCEIDQCFVRQTCDPKSLEYRRKHIYPNGIRTSRSLPTAPVFSRSGKSLCLPRISRLRVPRVAPPSNPLLQLTFCGTRLRSTGQFRVHFPSLPDRFCACDGFGLSEGRLRVAKYDVAIMAAGPAVMSRRFAPANSD